MQLSGRAPAVCGYGPVFWVTFSITKKEKKHLFSNSDFLGKRTLKNPTTGDTAFELKPMKTIRLT